MKVRLALVIAGSITVLLLSVAPQPLEAVEERVAANGATTTPTTSPAARRFTIRGAVANPDGAPRPDLKLELIRDEAAGHRRPVVATTQTARDGTFAFTDVPRHYRYILKGGSNEIGWVYEYIRMEPGADVDLKTLKLLRPE